MAQQTFPNLTELLEARTRLNANANDAETRLQSAVHKATASEVLAMTDKPGPVAGDVLMIEDSQDGYNKKKIALSALPPDDTAIHKAVAGEIAVMTNKAAPVDADLLVIEDSADSNNKKKIEIGNLPVAVLPAFRVGLPTSTTFAASSFFSYFNRTGDFAQGGFTINDSDTIVTIPEDGLYSLSYGITSRESTGISSYVRVNGVVLHASTFISLGQTRRTASGVLYLQLTDGDLIGIDVDASTKTESGSTRSHLSMAKLR